MKTTSITLTEQELNDLREFYTMQLARAKREVAHYESILSKLEKKENVAEKISLAESAAAVEPAKKRGRPRKAVAVSEPAVTPAPETETVEEKPKGKKGRPRKAVEVLTETPVEEKPKGKRGRKAKATTEAPVAEEAEVPATEKPKGKRGRPAKAEDQPKVKAKKAKAKPKKSKAKKSNTRGRKSVIPTVEIPYTDFIKETLADAPEALEAKDLIARMKEKYELEDKAKLKKAEMSLRSCLSGLLRNNKIASFKSASGNMKYYLVKPELEQEPVSESEPPAPTE